MDYSDETADGGTTYYVSIPTLHGAPHDTAIFIPSGFHQDPSLAIILYFHGYNDSYPDIRGYIHRPNTRPLRQIVADDGRFALIMPYLGKRSDGSHIVGSTQAFDAYLTAAVAQVMAKSGTNVNFLASPSVSLILAAHSGGGGSMSKAITLSSGYVDRVISAWAFDCFYENYNQAWIAWANSNLGSTLYMYYTDLGDPQKGTMQNSLAINAATGTNVAAQQATSHDEIPKTYFADLLSTIS